MGLKGQRVNQIILDEQGQQFVIHCSRDRRRQAVDPVTGKKGGINQHVRRQVRDVPLFGYPCVIELELAQVFTSKKDGAWSIVNLLIGAVGSRAASVA
ncbi:MAG: transposase [Flavobacterium sp.]